MLLKETNAIIQQLKCPIIEVLDLKSNYNEAESPYIPFLPHQLTNQVQFTDIYILLLYVFQYCSGKVYCRQGTGSSNDGIYYHNVK